MDELIGSLEQFIEEVEHIEGVREMIGVGQVRKVMLEN